MTIGKLDAQDALKIASTAFAVYSVVKTVRDARNDKDGLQFAEALMRGTTLALSIALIIRNLRQQEAELEGSEGMPA
jgi:hypothetical protein